MSCFAHVDGKSPMGQMLGRGMTARDGRIGGLNKLLHSSKYAEQDVALRR